MAAERIEIKGRALIVHGSEKERQEAIEKLNSIAITGCEKTDRLLIQEELKDVTALKKCNILYAGNTVYPYEPIIKEFKKLAKSDSLSDMSDRFYSFLHLNFDIAHYSKSGYIATYDNSFSVLWERTLKMNIRLGVPSWYTDLKRIADEIVESMEGAYA